MKPRQRKTPLGAVQGLDAMQAYLKQAKAKPVHLWAAWRVGENHNLTKLTFTAKSKLLFGSRVEGVDHNYRAATNTVSLGGLGVVEDGEKNGYIFDNYWMAYAYHQRQLVKLEKQRAKSNA
jgi:tRNA G18 (ribose-2'-O)-methylase SpoU